MSALIAREMSGPGGCPKGGGGMRRREVLQEARKMLFGEIYGSWQEKRLTQHEAVRLLGVCPRTFRRNVHGIGVRFCNMIFIKVHTALSRDGLEVKEGADLEKGI